ncbi:MAG: hypothetical protein EPO21_20685 [Chloroflexota bacterium]|nr:MAG: hypothetical protein EPO21_20685 [Chloroflexota bacterium]
MEPCAAFTPWHNEATGRTLFRYKDGKCPQYYFYFVDDAFGLCYLWVPTWVRFRLQVYCNGHNWLARQLDNAFADVADLERARTMAEPFPVEILHRALDARTVQYCPVLRHFGVAYLWILMQVEHATDIIIRRSDDLRPLHETLVRSATHTVRPEQAATFLLITS